MQIAGMGLDTSWRATARQLEKLCVDALAGLVVADAPAA
jgi:hypothetical protein